MSMKQSKVHRAVSPVPPGMISLLTVLILLLLTAFAVLSYTTAQAEARLTEKNITAAIDYYAADNEAEALFFAAAEAAETTDSAEACADMIQTSTPCSLTAAYTQDEITLTGAIPIDDARQLAITLCVREKDGRVTVANPVRRVESTAVWEDEGLIVWIE